MRHRISAIGLILALLFGSGVLAADNSRTLRVDYYHSGTATEEHFSLDRVVREPLPFPGNPVQPIDRTLRGKYEFQVLTENGTLLYSRSYSSIYGEWETTGEARRMRRTFHESVRFADPGEPVVLRIRKRGTANEFVTVWETAIDPGDYLVHEESAAYASEVVPIVNNGDPATKVDLLILGDGYTADEHADFVAKARELSDTLFSTSPFRERRDDFNVWALAPASAESGVSRPSTGLYRDTPFGATYDAFRSERYVLTYDNRELRRIISSAPYDFIEILTNSDTYGGGGIYGLYSTAAANNEWANYLFVHEFGHHFAGLADEYYTSSVAYEAPEQIIEPYEPNVTATVDPAQLKWRHLVEPGTPLPTPWPKQAYEKHSLDYQQRRAQLRERNAPEADMNALFRENREFEEGLFSKAEYRNAIGAFEGANYQASGYYRSELNCIMFTRTEAFCQVCADAVEQVIDEYSRGSVPD
jgi:IgA Peptidase M64/Peptidase M64 N-terminus